MRDKKGVGTDERGRGKGRWKEMIWKGKVR
jgi:hypothetical protein